MVRMLIVAYCYGIRFERRLCWVSLALSGQSHASGCFLGDP
jgi:hypothetical protein